MKIKEALTISLTTKALLTIEKLINLNSALKGVENIPKDASIIFAPNHFTRSETFIIPYFLNKIEGLKFSRSLADSSLFTSILGRYLRNLQTISTKDENRDQTIIADLASHQYNWVIYPEGQMMKDKKREHHYSLFQSRTTVKTGTAVLAMKAEFIRQAKNNIYPVCIVPTTISYVPIHPKENKIFSIAQKLVKKLPKRLEEELMIEGSLLLNSKMIIHFHKPIYVSDYILKESYISKLFGKTQDVINNGKIEKYRLSIAMKLAEEIYKHAQITHEHIISVLLQNSKNGLEKSRLGFLIVTCVLECQLHSNIQEYYENFRGRKLFNNIANQQYIDDFISLLEEQKLITQSETHIIPTTKFFETEYNFETVRIDKISKIFLNEINYFNNVDIIAQSVVEMSNEDIFKICIAGLEKLHKDEHIATFNKSHSITINNGKPLFFAGKNKKAVLLVHGYKSSPKEMEDVAKFLNGQGFTCYCTRMAGHGTSPFDMATMKYQDWFSLVQASFSILQLAFDEIHLCGFSTGGLICMQLAIQNNCKSLILINSAMTIADIRFRFVKVANFWSEMVAKFSKEHKGYIQDEPFYPDTNYSINHFSSMQELSKLMEKCNKDMPQIVCNTLVIQSNQDPIVHPKSGKLIFDTIRSEYKKLEVINSDHHVITRGEEFEKVKIPLLEFISRR